MEERLIVDFDSNGEIRLSQWRAEEFPAPPEALGKMNWPLDAEALEDLRWYLEDYLRAPFGVYGDRGPDIARRLPEWGAQIFESLFRSGPARDAYIRARARGGSLEIVLRSGAAPVLGLPWELMVDPGRPSPLALDGVAVTRSLPNAKLGEVSRFRDRDLRVLMVISRPLGAGDVGYQMIARPLLRRLEAVRGQVELTVLRPPTLERLDEVLQEAREAGKPFQIVHFDGHGAFGEVPGAGPAPKPWTFQGPGPQGMLAFEKPGGGQDLVPAESVARVLARAQVPVVVLNACQSAAMGAQVEAAVATRLLQEGAKAVIAMAYSVYAVAAAEFMSAFYERLFAGDRVAEAVAVGRSRLARRSLRPSAKGMLALADWMVPVLYARSEVAFPDLWSSRSAQESHETLLDRVLERAEAPGSPENEDLAPVGEFVGRDSLIHTLDVAARLQRVVVLHGPGGTGKTELAKAFGRWSRDTGAVDKPDWVITHSFEPGPAASGLSSVVDTVGLRVFGTRFAALGPERRLAAVEEVLSTRRLLLIWDNFEAAHTVPDPAAASMTEPERAALAAFLDRFARNSRSAIVITSRTPEAWLGEVRRVEVTGLERGEAVQYAEHLLAPYPNAQPRREQRAFGELMQWLEGHPLSMRLVLPRLDTTDPAQLLHRLKRGEALLLGPGDGMRNGSLAASIAHSFTHLSQAEQRALTLVGLVHGVADPNLLALVSEDSAAPQPFRGHTTEDWERLLRRAADLGLITEQDEDTYRIHSSLSAFLSAWWRADDPDGHRAAHAAATEALLRVYAQFGALLTRELSGGSASSAVAMIEIHRRTLTSLLGFACDQSEWQSAVLIVQPLYAYWKMRGRSAEAQAWTDRLRLALEGPDGTPPGLDTPAGGLWTLAALDEAARQTATHRLAEAERTYRTILAALGRLTPDREVRQAQAHIHHNLGVLAERQGLLKDATELHERSQNVLGEAGDAHGEANAFHHLGIVAHDQERLAEAEKWYLKALGIRERLGDQPGTAASHHHLGMVAQEQGRLAEATERYRKSLAILEALGDRPGTARSYSQLGMLAAKQGRPAAAEEWYRKSLTVREQLGNRHETAVDYHHLGILAQNQGRLAEAEDWCRRALRVSEETGNRPAVASSRHQLGKIAHLGGRHTEAEQWYRLSLEISEELDSRPTMVLSYGELGLLSEERGRYREAMEWTVRCLACFEEFPHPATGPGPQHLARLTSKLGLAVVEEVWPSVTGDALPAAIRDFVASE